jgi:hypothetical protein
MRQLHFSTSAHDAEVARLVRLIPASAKWSIRGYIHITGLLIAGNCESVDYELICKSALDVIDKTGEHTKDVSFRASPELVFPLNVKNASLVQRQLKGWAPTDDMLETRLPSSIVGIGLYDTAATEDSTLAWLLDKNPDTLPQPKLVGNMAWVIGYALERLHLEIVHRQVHLSDFASATLPKLCHLSLVAPMKGRCDVVHTWKSLVIDNTATAAFVVDLGSIPLTLEELVLKSNCTLKPPPRNWHHTMKRLSFAGGKPWTDAQALLLQQALPRHALIHIGTLGFSGALVSKSAEHLTWESMLRDTLQGLARVAVSAFDLAITEPLPLLIGSLSRLRSVHLNPDDVSLHHTASKRSQLAIHEVETNTSVASSNTSRMAVDGQDDDIIAIDLNEIPDDLPPLLNADHFPLNRLQAPQPSLQELQVDNKIDFFPAHQLRHIPNLRLSNLVRLVLNVPLRVQGSLGSDLPRSLVTLSLTKATEDPPGTAIKLFDLPPSMMYINVPKLLLDPPTVTFLPRTLKLLKAFNPAELTCALRSIDPPLAEQLFPPTAEEAATPSPSRTVTRTPTTNRSGSAASSQKSPTSPTNRKIRHQPIALDDDDDDDILAPYTPTSQPKLASPAPTPSKTPTKSAASSPATSSAITPATFSAASSTAFSTPNRALTRHSTMILDDDDHEDVLSPMPHPGSRLRSSSASDFNKK